MGLLTDVMAADNLAFDDLDGFAESAVYVPAHPADGSGRRSIRCIVDRDPVMPIIPGAKTTAPKMYLDLANNNTTGILSSEINFGGDSIVIAYRIGEPAKTFKIHQPADGKPWHDSARVRIELR